MSDDHWYRNTDWNDEIAARFELRLARSRTQKAQYLLIQGNILANGFPAVAATLFERSIAIGDEFHLARAQNGLALARLALGDIDAALAAYEAALETEFRLPTMRTSALADYVFAVAWHLRAERYPLVEDILAAARPSPFPGTDLQLDAARALIASGSGRSAEAASLASAVLAELAQLGVTTTFVGSFCGFSPSDLMRRLEPIAAV